MHWAFLLLKTAAAKLSDRIVKGTRYAMLTSIAYCGAVSLFINLFAEQLIVLLLEEMMSRSSI